MDHIPRIIWVVIPHVEVEDHRWSSKFSEETLTRGRSRKLQNIFPSITFFTINLFMCVEP